MRYLRMLSNAVLAGALGATYLVVLILQINPAVPLRLDDVLALLGVLALSYGIHLAAGYYVLIVLRQLLASEDISPGWLSFTMLSWLATLTAGWASWLTWMNLRTYHPVLEAVTARAMATGAVTLTVCALVFLALATVPYTVGRRGHRAGAVLLAVAVACSVGIPLWARGPGVPAAPRPRGSALRVPAPAAPPGAARVTMILLDGASLDFISSAASEGRLPNFGKLLDGGAAMHLETLRPTQPGPVWTAVATGRLPARNGVRSAGRYAAREGVEPIDLLPDYCFSHALVRFGFLSQHPHTSAALRTRPLWQILSGLGVSVGVVGWPLTHPAEPVNGYLVSDQFHRTGIAAIDIEEFPVIYPSTLLMAARSAADTAPAPLPDVTPAVSVRLPNGDRLAESDVMRLDQMYERVADALAARNQPAFTAVRLRGLDTIGHDFLRFAMPRAFGDVTDAERRRYGQVLVSAYSLVDASVGRALAAMAPGDLLLVVSGFGMEPLTVGKRLVERLLGNPQSGTHEGGPDGFLLAYGAAVEPGRRARASVLDVAPTVLYYFDLPLARDMDGYPRTDIFRKAFTAARPMTFIPSYER